MAHPTIDELKDRSPSKDAEIEATDAWYSEVTLRLITDMEQLRAFVAEAIEAGRVAVDLETSSLNSEVGVIAGVSLAYTRQEGVYVPVNHKRDKHLNLDQGSVWAVLQEMLNKVVAIFFNGKFDVSWFEDHGVTVPKWEDVSIPCFMLNTNRKTIGLKHMAKVVLGRKMLEFEDVMGKDVHDFTTLSPNESAKYAAGDALNTLELDVVLDPVKKEQSAIYRIETAAAEAIRVMERNRVLIDVAYCKQMWTYLDQEIKQVKAHIFELARRSFDIDSPKQCGIVLFDELKIPNLEEKTKTGQYDTSAEHLMKLEKQHPVCKLILTARSLAKAQATYVERLIEAGESDPRGAKFCFFNTRVPTGRMASGSGGEGAGYANVNVQSIPANYGEVIVEAHHIIDRPGFKKPDVKNVPVGRQFLWEEVGLDELVSLIPAELKLLKEEQVSTRQQKAVVQIKQELARKAEPVPPAVEHALGWEEVGDAEVTQLLTQQTAAPVVIVPLVSEKPKMPTEQEADQYLAQLDGTAGKPITAKPVAAESASALLEELDLEAPAKPAPSIVDEVLATEMSKVGQPAPSGVEVGEVTKSLSPSPSSEVDISDLLPASEIAVPPSPKKEPPPSSSPSLPPPEVKPPAKKPRAPTIQDEEDALVFRGLVERVAASKVAQSTPVVQDGAQSLLDSL